jgi:single-stranded-DNA-specific exonuclease
MSLRSLTGLLSHPNAERELGAAADLFGSAPGRWQVLYHNDGDGIASASVAVHLLDRTGRTWQLSPLFGIERNGIERILRATRGPLLVLDTGSSFLGMFAQHAHPVVVLDHHTPPGPSPPTPRLAFVNPHDWGVDGMTELSASMLTYLFAREVLPEAADLLAFGLSGAIADRMHVGGFRGLNRKIVERAEADGSLRRERGVNLSGPTLEEALAGSMDPYFVGMSGRVGKARAFLQEIGLPPHAPPSSLAAEEARRLSSALLVHLMSQGTRPEFCERVQEERLRLPRTGWEAHELSRWQNACGREGEPAVGIALALGDAGARRRAEELEARARRQVLEGLVALETPGALHAEPHLQWFDSPVSDLGGTIAGLALTYMTDPVRPVFSLSPRGTGTKVSSRGTLWLTDQGLDLDRVCREAAAKVGGEGGGHRVASGATIPKGQETPFLREADRLLGEQLAKLPASSLPSAAVGPSSA